MRQSTFAGVIGISAATLAASMLLVNFAFEAAGSVPDLEGCGFLAGSLSSLALIYPFLACLVAGRAACALLSREADLRMIGRAGAAIGAIGTGLYFGIGTYSAIKVSQSFEPSFNLWVLAATFVLVCAWAGKMGAVLHATHLASSLRHQTEN